VDVAAALPIDPFIPDIVARVRERRTAVITASPGAGKTTRVPPALAEDGPAIVLQPRRVAARSIARRIAAEQGWTLGREVGWHVRLEHRYTRETRVLLATEGILTARLQRDPLLSEFATVVLDEFHERSIHADLGIALAKQAWLARNDLRLVVMSATIDAGPVAAFLDGAPVIEVPGRAHPLDIVYRPGAAVADGVREAAARSPGQILCFLPGAPEIQRALPHVRAAVPAIEVVPLHGSLDAAEQDAAIAEVAHRRVILATNIAETSLTVPGVSAVVDSGMHKVARYDPDRAIDSLELERIAQDSADQRAGRAARLGPGVVCRLWSASDRLRPQREADIHRIDLSSPLLDVLAWGGDPRAFEWFEAPAADAIDAALELLTALRAVSNGRLTPLGRRMHRLPLHPRLAALLLSAGGSREAALACALLSERHFLAPRAASTSSDLLSAVEREHDLPPHVRRIAGELAAPPNVGRNFSSAISGATEVAPDVRLRRAVLDGYPDRVAKRREKGSPRFLLASGHGAVLGADSGVHDAEFIVAVDVQSGRRGEGSEARIRVASAIDRAWLTPTHSMTDCELDANGVARAYERDYYGSIVLREHLARPDAGNAAMLLATAYLSKDPGDADRRLLRRLQFAGIDVDLPSLVAAAARAAGRVSDIDIAAHLPWTVKRDLDRLAPERLAVPSGRSHALDYRDDGSVVASVKLQELFGLAETPRIGPNQEPVLLALLAPNGRPVQLTRDLKSFWERTYPEVRKELRGRYPRHPWPDDPWSAPASASAKRRR
jgi:ATP-dependent RNA helicase HrpB